MKLVTQDGRTLDLDRKYHLHIQSSTQGVGKKKKCKLAVATFTKEIGTFSDGTTYEYGGEIVACYGTIGEYASNTGTDKARASLEAAWGNGATEFTVPQDIFAKSDAEQFFDMCEEYGLTTVAVNELGYKPTDVARILKIWRETDVFERRGILVCDPETHSYAKSLAKWKALQMPRPRNYFVETSAEAKDVAI